MASEGSWEAALCTPQCLPCAPPPPCCCQGTAGAETAPLLQHHGGSRSPSQQLRDTPAPQRAPLPLPGLTSPFCSERGTKGDLLQLFPSLSKSQRSRCSHWRLTCFSSDGPSQECSFPRQGCIHSTRVVLESSGVPPDMADRNQLVQAAGELLVSRELS